MKSFGVEVVTTTSPGVSCVCSLVAGALVAALALIPFGYVLAATIEMGWNQFQELLFRSLLGDASAAEEAERWTVDAQSEGNPIVSCWARYAAGEVLAADDPERARRHIDAALELAEASGCRFVKGVAGLTAASLEARNGDPRRAAVAYRELLELWQLGSLGPIGVTIMRGVVEVLASLGDPETAAILHGAVAVSESAPAFGPDAYRQAALNRRNTHRPATKLERSNAGPVHRAMSDGLPVWAPMTAASRTDTAMDALRAASWRNRP